LGESNTVDGLDVDKGCVLRQLGLGVEAAPASKGCHM
jgi:hypothetical protein